MLSDRLKVLRRCARQIEHVDLGAEFAQSEGHFETKTSIPARDDADAARERELGEDRRFWR
jgi:hypothetical protein